MASERNMEGTRQNKVMEVLLNVDIRSRKLSKFRFYNGDILNYYHFFCDLTTSDFTFLKL